MWRGVRLLGVADTTEGGVATAGLLAVGVDGLGAETTGTGFRTSRAPLAPLSAPHRSMAMSPPMAASSIVTVAARTHHERNARRTRVQQITERDEQPGGDSPVALGHRSEQRRARRARLDVSDRVELRLAATVAGGEGQEHRAALRCRQGEATEDEQELEAQVGAGAGQAHGDRTAADVGLVGERRQVGAGDLVAQEEVPIAGIEAGQGGRQRRGLLVSIVRCSGSVGAVVLDEAVLVAALHGLAAEVRGEEVAGGDHGVGALLVGRELTVGAGEAQQRLLREVVDQVRIAGAGGEGPPDGGADVGECVTSPSSRSIRLPGPTGTRTRGSDVMAGRSKALLSVTVRAPSSIPTSRRTTTMSNLERQRTRRWRARNAVAVSVIWAGLAGGAVVADRAAAATPAPQVADDAAPAGRAPGRPRPGRAC